MFDLVSAFAPRPTRPSFGSSLLPNCYLLQVFPATSNKTASCVAPNATRVPYPSLLKLEQKLPTPGYSMNRTLFMEAAMARLFIGERECKRADLVELLERFQNGLKETEIAETLGWERRTVNNYLHDLERAQRVFKDGQLWFPEAKSNRREFDTIWLKSAR
jgi:hypothetical protein